MILSNETFVLYAAKHYDNENCFTESEFYSDLKKIGTIKRMISWLNNGDNINLHLLINNIVLFYNVFEHHAASSLLEFKMDESHWLKINAILVFLSLPAIGNQEFDLLLHRRIAQEYR
jgi:hypothetical protein